jgi:hypothetical protein
MKSILLKDGRFLEVVNESKRFYIVKKTKIGDAGLVRKDSENILSIVERKQ